MKIPSSKALLLSLANLALLRPASAFNLTRQAQVARQVQVIQDQFRMASTSDIAQEDMNVEGTKLQQHGRPELVTGWFRDNYCRPDVNDPGDHTIAGIVTKEFLEFSKARGNDLMTQGPKLTEGCRWCLCVGRWKEAFDAYKSGDQPKSVVPKINLQGTAFSATKKISLEDLRAFSESKKD